MGAEFGGTNHGLLGGGIVPFGRERERNEGGRAAGLLLEVSQG